MRKLMVLMITAAGLVGTSALNAQTTSSVEVFGTVDTYVGEAKVGPRSSKRLDDGGLAASRLGFRASEDLGDGLRANVMLEGGVATDTGSGTVPGPGFAFTRQSYIGLTGRWGGVELGRMYTPMFYALFRADNFGVNAIFSPINLVGATDGQSGMAPFAARASNMLRYRTPAGQDWFGDIAFAPGESAGRSGDLWGATFGYSKGPLYVGWGLQKAKSGSAAAPVAAPVTSTYQTLGASIQLPLAKLAGMVIRSSADAPGVPRAQLLNLNASVPMGGLSTLVVGVTERKVSGSARSQLAWTLGADYNLSKRTALYIRWLDLNNRGNASASLAGLAVTPNSGEDLRLRAIGIRHAF